MAIKEGKTIKYWQQIRSDRILMMELPDTLIKDNKPKEKFDHKLDPYDK